MNLNRVQMNLIREHLARELRRAPACLEGDLVKPHYKYLAFVRRPGTAAPVMSFSPYIEHVYNADGVFVFWKMPPSFDCSRQAPETATLGTNPPATTPDREHQMANWVKFDAIVDLLADYRHGS